MGTFHLSFYGLNREFRKQDLAYISRKERDVHFGGSEPDGGGVWKPPFYKKAWSYFWFFYTLHPIGPCGP
jgi:hypothetical protein